MASRPEGDDPKSRRAIDFYTAEKWVRIEEQLGQVKQKAEDAYEAIYGGKERVGLAEQMRSMLKVWGTIVAIASGILGSWTWIYDKLTHKGSVNLFGDEVEEKWRKQSTKRVRIFNKEKGAWEYYYMLSEVKVPQIEASKNESSEP